MVEDKKLATSRISKRFMRKEGIRRSSLEATKTVSWR